MCGVEQAPGLKPVLGEPLHDVRSQEILCPLSSLERQNLVTLGVLGSNFSFMSL